MRSELNYVFQSVLLHLELKSLEFKWKYSIFFFQGKQYDMERQLNEARLAKARMEAAEDKEKMLREKQILLLVNYVSFLTRIVINLP